MDILPQVSNYEEIMWINDWYFYGKWRKISDRTTYTGSDTDVWYKPDLTGNRINLLSDTLNFYDNLSGGYGYCVLQTVFKVHDVGPNIAVCNPVGGVEASRRALMTTAVYMVQDSNGWYINATPVVNLSDNVTWNDIVAHASLSSSPGFYNYRLYDVSVAKVEEAGSLSPGQLYNLKIYTNLTNTGRSYGSFVSQPSSTLNGMPKVYVIDPLDTNNHMNWVSSACPSDWWNDDKRYLESGAQINIGAFNKTTYQYIYNSMRYGLFGADNDTKTTLARYLEDKSIGGLYQLDYTGSAENTWVTGTWSEVKLSNLSQGGRTDAPPTPLNLNGRLQFPLLPQDFLKNLSSHLYKFKSAYLKLGDGLPISDGFDADGYCQISFDFGTKEMLNLTQKDYKIYIDAKNKNFNDMSGSYLPGYGDLVDPNNTTMTEKSMQRFVCDASTGKAKLTIPVKKGEELWIRIAPYSDEKGRFAYMKNLKCTYFR